MKFIINKTVYNVFKPYPKNEKISMEMMVKFGSGKKDVSQRAFFVELNIECKDGETEIETRDLFIDARLNYTLDKTKFKDLDDKEMEEDNKYFIELLNRLNKAIKGITSLDDVLRPLDIERAIKKYKKEKGD
ncbi:hypothetical protein [Metasolibacillus sp.]|uniref:hypothetical protein n=1 Tax=Metasolibacillus sp. TaxID=2703680 RepID=UPI0025E38F98|nr:hypothetical protein [Metasolibacillus sp.]MCT6925300.1 hypothetical protein [Metasolibacillus sp.]MCT6941470.1 hypothetical protein [Metasolibacillus sp.]